MSGIEGKVIGITGASSGIGEASALLLAERGGKVVLGARGSDRLKVLADRIVATNAASSRSLICCQFVRTHAAHQNIRS